MFKTTVSTLMLLGLLAVPPVQAESVIDTARNDAPVHNLFYSADIPAGQLLAAAEGDEKAEPESGTLVIPGEEQNQKKKQCLNVCKQWGEDCIINPRTGSRNCRRTCKQFGEECF